MQNAACFILVAALFTACGGKPDSGPPPDLFATEAIKNPPQDFPGSAVAKRHRFARLNPAALQRLAAVGSRVRLNLFDDLVPIAVFTDSKPGITQSHNHAGHLETDPKSSVMLIFTQEVMSGAVTTGDGRQFQISHINADNYAIFEIAPPTGRLKGN
jgi:hypothetical protein